MSGCFTWFLCKWVGRIQYIPHFSGLCKNVRIYTWRMSDFEEYSEKYSEIVLTLL